MVHAPSRCLAGILRSLQGHLSPSAYTSLSRFSETVIRYLRVHRSLKQQAAADEKRADDDEEDEDAGADDVDEEHIAQLKSEKHVPTAHINSKYT